MSALQLCHLLRGMLSNMNCANLFAVLRDETRDVRNREKLTLCIRWIDEDFTIHEDLIGIVHVDKTNSDLKCY